MKIRPGKLYQMPPGMTISLLPRPKNTSMAQDHIACIHHWRITSINWPANAPTIVSATCIHCNAIMGRDGEHQTPQPWYTSQRLTDVPWSIEVPIQAPECGFLVSNP